MKEQSEAEKEVVINMGNTVEESSTPRNEQEIRAEPRKIPKVQEKNEGPTPISNNNEESTDLHSELDFMLNKEESSTPRSNTQVEGSVIPKVPKMLRDLEKNKGCFDPLVVSIGPYHHGKKELQEGEKLKTELARLHCKTRSKAYDLYKRVKVEESKAREFYDKEALENIDNKAFTDMMFIDGCFVLEFMIMCLLGGQAEYHYKKMIINDIANVKRDLFLLENQLPYIVLEALMKDKKTYSDRMTERFIIICHRLHPADKPEDKPPLHLLDMMKARFVIQSATIPSSSYDNDWHFYYPARVLKSMGIQFKPNKTGSLSDVKFESRLFIRRVLTLPPICIDASTKSLLLNLVAFESSCRNNSVDNMQQGVITSYLCFMDSLIDNADDVMILRTHNIINNCLGNDQLVADLFNEIASNLVLNPHTYAEAKLGIQNHCNDNFKKWMVKSCNINFDPWYSSLALYGFLLTAAQTYLAVMQLKQ